MDLTYNNITTKEDYKSLFGVDLDIELSALVSDVGDKPSARFIHEIEELLRVQYSAVNGYSWDGVILDSQESRRKNFRLAVCYQIEYYLLNGSIHAYSGYDAMKGTIIPRTELDKIGISLMTHNFMRRGGMANL